jgi:hypothetical protein
MVISQKMIEREMDNRGSKPVASSTVKEQRVDGHWYGFNLPYLRCTLMGFERNYQIKILSNQIQTRSYTSLADKEQSSSVDSNSSLLPAMPIPGIPVLSISAEGGNGQGGFPLSLFLGPFGRIIKNQRGWLGF